MKKIISVFKNKKYLYILIAAVAVVIIGIVLFSLNKKVTADTITISHSSFNNQVSISGKVVPAEEVDLALNKGGKIVRIFTTVGQYIKAGTSIVKIDAKDAENEVHDAEIALSSAKLTLEKAKVSSSEENMNSDLLRASDTGFTSASDTFVDISDIVPELKSILDEDNLSENSASLYGQTAARYREDADKLYYESSNALESLQKSFRLVSRSSKTSEVEKSIQDMYSAAKTLADALKTTKSFLDYLSKNSNNSSDYSSYQSDLSDNLAKINADLASLLSAQNSIKSKKDSFTSTNLDMQDLELTVAQKESDLEDARNRLADFYIRAPFDGLVTNIDAKLGEIASSGTPLVSMMSAGTFQIESYVPEISISLLKLGDEAKVTLDAYGDSIVFGAKIVSVDPAETIKDGVSTYKIKFQCDDMDERIKSGMTANVAIGTFSKENVIVLPGGVVFDKGGRKFVQVKEKDRVSDREITIGNVSSLGQVEVVSGLMDGEQVILKPNP